MSWGRSTKQARLELLNRPEFGGRRGRGEGIVAPYPLVGALLVVGIGLGVLHNRLHSAQRVDPILAGVSAALVPTQVGAVRLQNAALFSWDALFGGKRIKDENLRLQAEVARLTGENEALRSSASEVSRLQSALRFQQRTGKTSLSGEVIAWLPSASVDTITVARGLHDGVRSGTIVRTPFGLVGQVTESGLFSAQTLLLSDVSSEVGVLVRRGGKMQAVGVAQGTGRGQSLNLKYLRREDDVRKGDKVYSSGYGGVVPPDIPIGTIATVTEDKAHFLKTARISPAVPLPGDLREVYLLRPTPAEPASPLVDAPSAAPAARAVPQAPAR
ncbi:MAG: rod shape-determining protein MreC [Cytophagales bacterium]|nr:rod shape-determining protein MreC [Armatimonadota bacterium]